jgi:uncharacterized protein YbaP (TraB family)
LPALALLLAAALAQPAAAQAPAAPAADPGRHPLLWKVSDADNAVYLLGSFHLLRDDDYPLPGEVDRAFDDAEGLLFEVDPAELTAPETQDKIQAYMVYDDGETLSTVLPKPTFDRLQTLVTASGGSMQALEGSEPWAVSMGLVLGVAKAMGFESELGLDRHLMARAAEAGKPVAGLETVDDQLRSMDAVSRAEQAASLDEFLTDPRKATRELMDMHAWWRAGDVARLDAKMRAEMARKTPEFYRLLDVERNAAWLPRIEARLRAPGTDDTLVVVGSLHLLGPDGLVEKLRAKGFRVERVCDACAAD